MDVLQIIGYVGSALIALSLTMNNLLRLRWINLFGASTFAFYGYMIDALPVLALNGFITLTDIFYLVRMYRQKEYFDLLKIQDLHSPYLRRFLEFFDRDIQTFFPGYCLPFQEKSLIVFVMRNLKPAGLFIGRLDGVTCQVCLDYVTPEYRDLKGGHYLWGERREFFKQHGIEQVVSPPFCTSHERYLVQTGFVRLSESGETSYKLILD